MCLVGGDQVHVPVQPGTGVPARLLLKVLEAYRQDVLLSVVMHQIGDIEQEAIVTVGPVTRLLAIHIDTGVAHGTVKLDGDPFPNGVIRQGKAIAVPTRSGEGKPAGTTVMLYGGGLSILYDGHSMDIVLLVERAIDSPIVRHANRLPCTVVVRSCRCTWIILPGELPSLFEGDLRPALSPCQRQSGYQGNENKNRPFHHSIFFKFTDN